MSDWWTVLIAGLDCIQAVCDTQQVSYQGQMLDLEKPFKKATMHELVQEALGQSPISPRQNFSLTPAEARIPIFHRCFCFKLLLAPIPSITYFSSTYGMCNSPLSSTFLDIVCGMVDLLHVTRTISHGNWSNTASLLPRNACCFAL